MTWLAFAVVLAYGEQCATPEEFGRIEVIARDSLGAKLTIARTELVDARTQKAVDMTKPVPYGSYTLRIVVPGFRTSDRRVNLHQRELVVRAEFVFDMMESCPEVESIHGRVKAAPDGRELFVKVVPLLGVGGGGESRVGPYGDFLIDGLESGNYLLLVMDGKKAIHTETVVANDKKSLSIEL
ncbi:MAG TPA: hypothetical protein VMT15_14845 [Bryobacteraceae bacterium]|nr:hypothetical protein [Bryobacteraceae bacterium]